MSRGFHQAKLNRSVVKDLRKQTLAQFGANGFRLGETAFVSPPNIPEVRPRELVGKIVGRDRISATWWLSLYDDGRDSFVEDDLHKLIRVNEASNVASRAIIVRTIYEIREWEKATSKVGPPKGHVVIQKYTSVDHQGRPISLPPEYDVLEILFDGQRLF
jgi:hypothetical protein